MGCIVGNKTAVIGNSPTGGPVKNHPLNVFQLSKHWCFSFLCCLCGGRLERALHHHCRGTFPEQPLLAFCSVHPDLSALKRHRPKKYPLADWLAWAVPAAAQSVSRQTQFVSSPVHGSCFELELEGAWSHGIFLLSHQVLQPQGDVESMAGMCVWPTSQ